MLCEEHPFLLYYDFQFEPEEICINLNYLYLFFPWHIQATKF